MRTERNARQLKCIGQGARRASGYGSCALRDWKGLAWPLRFFAKGMTSPGGNGPQHYCKLSYGVIHSPVGTLVGWRLTLLVFLARAVTAGARSPMSPINKRLLVFKSLLLCYGEPEQ